MHDFAVKDLMVTVLPEAAECPEGGRTAREEECNKIDCNTCREGSNTNDETTGPGTSRATERDFKVLDRELRRILDQS